MEYGKQHTVTSAYLSAWCDPNTPEGQTPYVWIMSRDGKVVKNKAPKKIFRENNFYTVYNDDGTRNLVLEKYLHEVEDNFLRARRVIQNHGPPSDQDVRALILFISSSFARTKLQKEQQSDIWTELLEIYQALGIQNIQPDLYRQVEIYKKQPMPYHIGNFLNITTPVLSRMNITILETTREEGFVTSDNPALWLDPSITMPNKPISFFGLGSPLLDIFFPISPNFLVELSWSQPDSYVPIDSQTQMIEEINKMTVMNSEEFVVMNHNSPNPYWFED
jgi:hypothetical protein